MPRLNVWITAIIYIRFFLFFLIVMFCSDYLGFWQLAVTKRYICNTLLQFSRF